MTNWQNSDGCYFPIRQSSAREGVTTEGVITIWFLHPKKAIEECQMPIIQWN